MPTYYNVKGRRRYLVKTDDGAYYEVPVYSNTTPNGSSHLATGTKERLSEEGFEEKLEYAEEIFRSSEVPECLRDTFE